MARDDIHLVTFDDACKLRFRFEFDHARTQLGGHLMNIIFVQTEFLCDLLIRQVETQQVQTDDPFAQWLVMVGEDRVGQIIEVPLTGIAMIPLPFAQLPENPRTAPRRGGFWRWLRSMMVPRGPRRPGLAV